MKVVFVCSPFQGKQENIERAKGYCRMLVEMGYIPIAPHVYFSQFMDDHNPKERRLALDMSKKLLEFCDELWIFGDEITEGMREEIEFFVSLKGLNRVRFAKIVEGNLVTVGLFEHLINNARKIDSIHENLQRIGDRLEKIESELRRLKTSTEVREREIAKRSGQKLEITVDKSTIDGVWKAVEEIYYLGGRRKVEKIPVTESFSFVVYHGGREGINKELKPETESGIVVKVKTEGEIALELIPFVDGNSQGGVLISRRVKDLKGKVVEKVKEILKSVYNAKVVPKEADKDPNFIISDSWIAPKQAVSEREDPVKAVRKCPQCGGDMYYDLVASQPRSFSGELKPRLICTTCGFTVQG